MKLLVIFAISILFAVSAQCSLLWKPNYKYVFKYKGQELSTVENVGNRLTGYGMRGLVTVYVEEGNRLTMQLTKWKTASLDDDVEEPEHIDWAFHNVQGPIGDEIEIPVQFKISTSDISDIIVSANDSYESINIKKALMTLVQLSPEKILGRQPRQTPFSNRAHLASQNSLLTVVDDVSFARYTEDGVGGKCESIYVTSSDKSPFQPEAEVLNISKKINYDLCEERPSWVRTTILPVDCPYCDADKLHPFTTVSNIDYDLYKNESQLIIESIRSVAVTSLKPFTGKSDYMTTNQTQELTLLYVEEIQEVVPVVDEPEPTDSLQYVFPTAKRAIEGPEPLIYPPREYRPLVPFLYDGPIEALEEAKDMTDTLIKMIFEETQYSVHKEEVTVVLYKVIQAVKRLTFQETDELFNYIVDSQKTEDKKSLIVQLMAMSGNLQSIMYLTRIIMNETVSEEIAVQAIQSIATNALEPTAQLIEQIMILGHTVSNSSLLSSTIWPAFAILVSKACNSDNSPIVPERPYAQELCTQQQEEIYLRNLGELLAHASTIEEQLVLIESLGLTKLLGAAVYLEPFVLGIATDVDIIQIASLRALQKIALFSPEKALKVAEKVFYDVRLPANVRIAALRVILHSKPTFSDLQDITQWLVSEPSDEVTAYVVSAFQQLGNASHCCLELTAEDASQLMVFLDKEADNGIQGSKLYEWSQTFGEDGISAQTALSVTGSNTSIVPEGMHLTVNTTIAGQTYQIFDLALTAKGLQPIIDAILGTEANFKKFPTIREIFEPESRNDNQNRSRINREINLLTRIVRPFSLSGSVTVAGTQTKGIYIDHKQIIDYFDEQEDPLKITKNIHLHSLSLPYEVKVQVPSQLGTPIVLHYAAPKIINVKGNVSAELITNTKSILPEALKVSVNLTTKSSSHQFARLGSYNPLSKKVSMVAVQSVAHLNAPVKLTAYADVTNVVVQLKVKPVKAAMEANDDKVTLAMYKVEPHSCVYPVTTTTDNCDEPNPIINDPIPYNASINFRRYQFPLTVHQTSEHPWPYASAFYSYLREFDSPITFANVWWKTPEFASRRYSVVYNGTEGLQDSSIDFMMTYTYVPTPTEQRVLTSKTHSAGFWDILTGFARLPPKCRDIADPESEQKRLGSSPDDEVKPARQQYVDSTVINYTREPEVSLTQVTVSAAAVENTNILSSLSGLFQLKRDLDELDDDISLVLRLSDKVNDKQYNLLLRGTIDYPQPPCLIKHQINPMYAGKINLDFKGGWTEDSLMNPQFNIKGEMKKSEEQLRVERLKSEWYYSCEKDLIANTKYSEACETLVKKINSFNLINMNITYKTDLPEWVYNVTRTAYTFAKVSQYLQMTNNPVRPKKPAGTINITASIYNDRSAYNVQLYTPTADTFFKKVPNILPVYPVSSVVSVQEQLIDEVTNGYARPSCDVMEEMVRTLNNQSFALNIKELSGCRHVLLKDCSTDDLFAITMQTKNDDKIVFIYVLHHFIRITPRRQIFFDENVVRVDNEQVAAVNTSDPSAPNATVAVFAMAGPKLHVLLPMMGVTVIYDWKDIKIEVSNMLKGQVCGLCGEFRQESHRSLIDAEQCLRPDPISLATTYDFMDVDYPCQLPTPSNPNKVCPQETLPVHVGFRPASVDGSHNGFLHQGLPSLPGSHSRGHNKQQSGIFWGVPPSSQGRVPNKPLALVDPRVPVYPSLPHQSRAPDVQATPRSHGRVSNKPIYVPDKLFYPSLPHQSHGTHDGTHVSNKPFYVPDKFFYPSLPHQSHGTHDGTHVSNKPIYVPDKLFYPSLPHQSHGTHERSRLADNEESGYPSNKPNGFSFVNPSIPATRKRLAEDEEAEYPPNKPQKTWQEQGRKQHLKPNSKVDDDEETVGRKRVETKPDFRIDSSFNPGSRDGGSYKNFNIDGSFNPAG